MIEVRAVESLDALPAGQLEALSLSAQTPSLFTSAQWLRHFLARDLEWLSSGARPYFLTGWEGARLSGFLALRRVEDRLGRTLRSLMTLEVERPRVVAAAGDEGRVASAFLRYLQTRADEWDVLEFVMQDPTTSPLHAGPAALGSSHWLRRMPDRNNNVLSLEGKAPLDYARSLSKNMRINTRQAFQRLFRQPGFSLLTARRPAARALLFEVFLEIERKSWKPRVDATIGAREPTYRAAVLDPAVDLSVGVALLDGLPIAGTIWAEFGRRAFHLQTVFAESHQSLSAGTLMTWVPLEDAFARRAREFDMLPDFSHYKARWGARTVATDQVQVFRVGSLKHLKAVAGDFARKVLPQGEAAAGAQNPYRVAAGRPAHASPVDVGLVGPLLAEARANGALEESGEVLAARNPFLA